MQPRTGNQRGEALHELAGAAVVGTFELATSPGRLSVSRSLAMAGPVM